MKKKIDFLKSFKNALSTFLHSWDDTSLIVKFMHTFLAYYVSLLLVMVMKLNRMPSIQFFHEIVKFCFNN